MALDLDKISPDARKDYIRVGADYASEDTLSQSEKTLQGYSLYDSELAPFGFIAADAARLKEAAAQLRLAFSSREVSRVDKRQSAATYQQALRRGKDARGRANAMLFAIVPQLRQEGASEALNSVAAALQQTRIVGPEDLRLGGQLDALRQVLADNSIVAAAAKGRGGPALVKELAEAHKGLVAASFGNAGSGTTAQQAKLDLLDGLLVELCRTARRIARVAARSLGRPEIAEAFELTFLSSRREKPAPPTPKTP